MEFELKQIKELMAAMSRTGTKKLQLKQTDSELVLERQELTVKRSPIDHDQECYDDYPKKPLIQQRMDHALSRGTELPTEKFSSTLTHEASSKPDINQIFVTSPMVGTFYASSSPDDASFVKVGDKIDKNTIVCIIEAMKVMNEIKANLSGKVAEILVESGQPVEFGSKLFRITE